MHAYRHTYIRTNLHIYIWIYTAVRCMIPASEEASTFGLPIVELLVAVGTDATAIGKVSDVCVSRRGDVVQGWEASIWCTGRTVHAPTIGN